MTRDRASGVALILGAVAGLVTMALHPSAHDLVEAVGRSPWPARLNLLAHSLAIASSPVLFFGAVGLTRRLTPENGVAGLALATYGFALVAVMSAAIASGLIAPHLVGALAAADANQRPLIDAIFHYNGQVNQAFAAVFVVLSSVAIALWSAAILQGRGLPRWIGLLGCVVAALVLLGFLGGHLRLTVHGFGVIVISQSVWLVSVGASLGWPRSPAL